MSDELAIKIFAAENGFEDEAVAKATMYKHGFADEYIKRAETLQPVFQEAYQDGIDTGLDAALMAIDQIGVGNPPNADVERGARAALRGVKEAIEVARQIIDEKLNPGATDDDPVIAQIEKFLRDIGATNVRVQTAR